MPASFGASQLFVILGKTSKPSESLRLLQDLEKSLEKDQDFIPGVIFQALTHHRLALVSPGLILDLTFESSPMMRDDPTLRRELLLL